MMLEHLGHPDAAKAIVDAVEAILVEGPRTRDVGGTAGTTEMGKAVADAL
jgi:tartrate dehydrogenase/decarboxylase/D-malate dehydrogenase